MQSFKAFWGALLPYCLKCYLEASRHSGEQHIRTIPQNASRTPRHYSALLQWWTQPRLPLRWVDICRPHATFVPHPFYAPCILRPHFRAVREQGQAGGQTSLAFLLVVAIAAGCMSEQLLLLHFHSSSCDSPGPPSWHLGSANCTTPGQCQLTQHWVGHDPQFENCSPNSKPVAKFRLLPTFVAALKCQTAPSVGKYAPVAIRKGAYFC